MDTPRARSPRPVLPPRPSSKPTTPRPPPPPSPRRPRPLSAATSPSRDFSFAASSSPLGGGHHPLSMSRAPVVGRVGSDLSHTNYAKTSRHATTSCRNDGGDRAKPFISGGAWRKERSSGSDTTGGGGGKPGEEKRKDKARRGGLDDVSQWVKRRVAAMVEQLRASFSRQQQQLRRRRPHSFSGHGPNAAAAAARGTKEERRRQRGRGHLSSAPASLRVSPANSGHLSVGASVTKVSTSSEESTMEELQSAIEAAIAHCKNSISRGQPDDGGRRG